jgi:hypothetical protein
MTEGKVAETTIQLRCHVVIIPQPALFGTIRYALFTAMPLWHMFGSL